MKNIGVVFLFVFIFYVLYPKALAISGSSFISVSGVLGLALYFYNGRPYSEVLNIGLAYSPIVLMAIISSFFNSYTDPYMYDYTKSQLGWIFSSYMAVFFFFMLHPKGSFVLLLYYIVGAIFAQCVISLAMHQNEAVKSFFTSLQMADAVEQFKRDDTEGQRLLGYGVAFFGAGLSCGCTLIFLVYIAFKQRLNIIKLSLLALVYCFVLYIGLLSARTTSIGLFASVILAAILLLTGNSIKGQPFKFIGIAALLGSVGTTLCYMYFPEFADWAFEGFINYQKTGKFTTQSSDALDSMFLLPYTFEQWLYGWGHMEFWGSDVGYTRLLFWIGLPGTIAYFFYQFYLIKMSFIKDQAWIFTLLVIFAYNFALNMKGLSDLNFFFYFLAFYFLHYRYYVYTPKLYRNGKISQNKLRHAVQSKKANGRI